ncbi:two-component response regulator 24-like [Abrus precatorius]|uniref:Two-component response regulator 24-like n=1 Tax=Abrus precatorius TaxID=3816 RepID=A0A8B8L8G5_ABRPR|nr:two-component response regulator 24-like [Abrus precatorius]
MESMNQLNTGAGSSNSSSSKISALIVDDDAVTGKIHKTLLESLFKIETKTVKDGKEAVNLCRSGAKFDIIFMDKEMPIMDGVEATKQLRAMGVKSMIVGITSRADGKETQEFLAAGLNHCLEKPLKRAMVEVVLRELKNLSI